VKLPTGDLALRQGSEIAIARSPELLTGDVLVVPTKKLTMRSVGSEAVVSGAARMSRRFALTVASYTGAADVSSAGSRLVVRGLRQATIPLQGQVPQAAEPLRYSNDDQWDRRFLADAIDLGVELQARSDGATAQFEGQGRTAGFYRTLMPELDSEPAFDVGLLNPNRPPGEHLVGAGIALAGTRGAFADRWAGIFAFRGEGATWGLVAMDQSVERVPGLLKRIDDALGRVTLPGQSAAAPSAPAPTTPTTRPSLPPTTTPTTRPGSPTTTQPTTPTTQPPGPVVTIPNPPDELPLPINPPGDNPIGILEGLLPNLLNGLLK
jgi:hypothetical protein